MIPENELPNTVEDCNQLIKQKRALQLTMVGNLYPSILEDEIFQLVMRRNQIEYPNYEKTN